MMSLDLNEINTDKFFTKVIIQPNSKNGLLQREDIMSFEALFQSFMDQYFYIKDINGRWISCNTKSLELLNFSSVSDVIGMKEDDFFPREIAKTIRQDDLKILEQGQSVLNRIELIPDAYGELIWVQTNKLPIYNIDNKVIGIIGITRPILEQKNLPQKFELFRKTITFIRVNLDRPIMISDLASSVKLSQSQFRRKFAAEFGISPQKFILRARIQAAAHALRSTSDAISLISAKNGFADQSYFTRQFKYFFGETPKNYQHRWQSGVNPKMRDKL